MKSLLLFLSLVTISLNSYSQTTIGGGVFSNTTWTKDNSPYQVTSNVVVFPNVTLTIEPGVELYFDDGLYIEVRGLLIAEGTISDTIIFSSSSNDPKKDSWLGVSIKNEEGGNANFSFCKFKHASTAILEQCCGGGLVSVNRSRFEYNHFAISGYSGDDTPVDSCYFENNHIAILRADKNITYSTFKKNFYGLYNTERINVSNSSFINNHVALNGGRGTITNTYIAENDTGVVSFFEGFTINDSEISTNNVGVILGDYSNTVNTIYNSKLCDNILYNIINDTPFNVDLTNICWCEPDNEDINDKIYDAYDNVEYGIINFTSDESCLLLTNTSYNIAAATNVSPNPSSSDFTISSDFKIQSVKLYDVSGKMLATSKETTFNVSGFPKGLYYLKILTSEGEVSKKIVIQ